MEKVDDRHTVNFLNFVPIDPFATASYTNRRIAIEAHPFVIFILYFRYRFDENVVAKVIHYFIANYYDSCSLLFEMI